MCVHQTWFLHLHMVWERIGCGNITIGDQLHFSAPVQLQFSFSSAQSQFSLDSARFQHPAPVQLQFSSISASRPISASVQPRTFRSVAFARVNVVVLIHSRFRARLFYSRTYVRKFIRAPSVRPRLTRSALFPLIGRWPTGPNAPRRLSRRRLAAAAAP